MLVAARGPRCRSAVERGREHLPVILVPFAGFAAAFVAAFAAALAAALVTGIPERLTCFPEYASDQGEKGRILLSECR